jgi:(p)ppGpp synthase/HD superfamily hydrolase
MTTSISDGKAFHDDYADALVFATRLHATQLRKGTPIPYISHLISVSALVLEHGGSRDQAIAALLHDSIEDQAKHYRGGIEALRIAITRRFGDTVLEIVEACTDATTDPKPPWKERKQEYVTHLAKATDATRLVSCADKVHNARSVVGDLRILGNALWSRFIGGQEGSLWYYRALADEFLRGEPAALAAELDRTVREMERLSSQA